MDRKTKISKLQDKISNLEAENSSLMQKESVLVAEKQELEKKAEELKKEVDLKNKQLTEKELRKLAQAYAEQEYEFKIDVEKWFKFVIVGLAALLVSIGISTWLASSKVWYDKFEYYLVDFVFVTFLIFSLKQYSSSNNLRVDFANRKTVAQSYHNIIGSTEDEDIKDEYLSKATDVLCAPSKIESDSYTIPEKIIETLSDTVKLLSKK